MNLFEEFKRHRAGRADEPAFLITSGDRSVPVSWRRFTDDIALVAWVIQKHVPGATIGLLGENSYEWITAHAACLFADAVVVPIDTALAPEEIARRLKFVGASVLIYSALYKEKGRAVEKLLPGLATGGFGSRKADFFLDEARAAIAKTGVTVFDGPGPDRVKTATLVFTSGTTSEPRGAEVKIEGIEAFGEFGISQLRVRPGDRSLMILPLHHIYGICATYLMLAAGVSLGVCPDFRRLYDAVLRFRVNFLFLVPALAELLAVKISRHGTSADEVLDGHLDWIVSGGAPLPTRVHELLESLGIKPLTAYGLTETTALYAIAPNDGTARAGSAGARARVEGVETKVSESGELMIRGKNVMRGYYKMPEATAKVLTPDGWFKTGDVGHIDEEGFVWVTGRASRTIVLLSGKKVAPEELENKILNIPSVLETIVSGDSETREIRADIYTTSEEGPIRQAIVELNRTLPTYQRVSRVEFRSEPFPRTASGKIRLPRATVRKEQAPTPAEAREKEVDRLGRALFVVTPATLTLGVALRWLSNVIPDICRLAGHTLPDDRLWICRLTETIGEAVLFAAFLMFVALLKKLFFKWWRRSR